jgi:hypothetical protein
MAGLGAASNLCPGTLAGSYTAPVRHISLFRLPYSRHVHSTIRRTPGQGGSCRRSPRCPGPGPVVAALLPRSGGDGPAGASVLQVERRRRRSLAKGAISALLQPSKLGRSLLSLRRCPAPAAALLLWPGAGGHEAWHQEPADALGWCSGSLPAGQARSRRGHAAGG